MPGGGQWKPGSNIESVQATSPRIERPDLESLLASDLRLVVLGSGAVETYPLPAHGKLTIGRTSEVDVPLNDPQVSRTHAIIEITSLPDGGSRLVLRDAGSSNGTKLRGNRLGKGDSVAFEVGDLIEVGGTTLIVQRSIGVERRHRLWTHGHFELRLEEECARARRSGGRLAVLRVRVKTGTSTTSIEERLLEIVGADHLVAIYAPGEYEALLIGADHPAADGVAKSIRNAFASTATSIAIGIACYPQDAQSAETLVARAGANASDPEPDDTSIIDISENAVIENRAMRSLYELAARIADSDINVLVLGETGVGKEVLARSIHDRSPRSSKPFIALNCVAMTETLLESELFGHEKGAFTGAVQPKPGLFEIAEGGTVFLDEIGEMPIAMQAKMLRVLEERRARRVGGLKTYAIDVRFIAATNRDLAVDAEHGAFRRDLYYRLNGISLMIPPLRDRVDEIAPLANLFAARALAKRRQPGKAVFAPEVIEQLQHYHWPGNVRELKNEIERAVVLARGGRIERAHVSVEKFSSSYLVTEPPQIAAWGPRAQDKPIAIPRGVTTTAATGEPDTGSLQDQLREVERRRILEALEACDGNQTRAAEMLGMSRKALRTRLDSYDIPRPRKGKTKRTEDGE